MDGGPDMPKIYPRVSIGTEGGDRARGEGGGVNGGGGDVCWPSS